jgi:uncharacterized protein (TIGR03503 family)
VGAVCGVTSSISSRETLVQFKSFPLFLAVILTALSSLSWANEQQFSLLDNRFRIDPTIQQVSFVIYRSEQSQSVVLVRPDGVKYYAWQHPEHVAWYEENGMDIISIDQPMPGPWQAIGKVTPKNNIKILSDLMLDVDFLSNRLYQNERIKLQANLTTHGAPIVLRDFLDRVNLRVTFTPYVENESQITKEARPIPIIVGEFSDDGLEYDEVAGDGKFTVDLPINVEPGKYRVRVTSGNGVFLRAVEQEVLVYPPPITVDFSQSRTLDPHSITIVGERATIAPGSISAHISVTDPEDNQHHYTTQVPKDSSRLKVEVASDKLIGNHSISTIVYATDLANNRDLVLETAPINFGSVESVDVEKAREQQRIAQEKQQKEEMLRQIELKRAEDRKRSLTIIIVGNIAVLIIGLVVAFIVYRRRKKAAAEPELQLSAPPS